MNIDYYFKLIANFGEKLLFFDVIFWSDKFKLPFLIFWLLFASFYFSIILKFQNFRFLFRAFVLFFKDKKIINKKNNTSSSKNIVLSATGGAVDLGTIFGVASIVVVGGPGTIFWLLFAGLISTSIRFAEVFCGHKFRKKIFSNGEHVGYNGGPQIYIKKIFMLYKFPKLGNIIAKIFAFNIMISTFCSLQINQSVHVVTHTIAPLANYSWFVALAISIMVISIASRGLSSIAKFSSKVVPWMVLAYISCTILILIMNIKNLIPSIILIISDAFSFKAVNGGLLGAMILGVQRAFFCNESGSGSGAIIHASSTNANSYKEALISMVTPIISVLIVCFCSGMIVITTGVYSMADSSSSGIDFVIKAFETIHPLMRYFTLIIVPIFGITTAIAWAYYGSKSYINLFGQKTVGIYYLLLFVAYFLCGTVKDFNIILSVADILNLSVTIPNIIALFMFSRFIIRGTRKKS